MDGSSSLALSGVSDAPASFAPTRPADAGRASAAVPVQSVASSSVSATDPATSPAAVSSARSLDTLVEISSNSAEDINPAQAVLQSGASIASLAKSQLDDISILDISVSEIAGLTSQELDELMPAT